MSVDWSRSIQTEDGDKARLLCTDVNDPKYHVAVGVTHCGKEYVRQYTLDGHPDGDIPNIINVPPRKVTREVEAWAVVDKTGTTVSVSLFSVDPTPLTGARVVRLTGTVDVEVAE